MSKKYDLIVVGSGSAASRVARICRGAGWEVALVDSRPFGGTCALRGCDPKKVLVGAAEAVDWVRRMKGKGVRGEEVSIDWRELMRFKRTFTDPVPPQRKEGFRKEGIHTFEDRARFIGPTAFQVGTEILEGHHVLIAAGAKPAELSIPGEEHLTTSDEFMELEGLPSRILFVGGGYISFEFCHVAVRTGAEVTLLHRSKQPLSRFDPDLVSLLVQCTRKLGVEVRLETAVSAIERSEGNLSIKTTSHGETSTLTADMVVHGAGRVPNIDDMDLEKGEVKREKRGVSVNEYLQSISNPRVYAAGDAAASGLPLTPVASYEAQIVADNLLEGNHRTTDYPPIPSVVFSVPPLASVGLLEEEAREKGLKFETHYEETSGWYTSRRMGEECSGFKVLIEKGGGRVLGAHLLGGHAEEMINLFALAMGHGIRADALGHMIAAYPTKVSDISHMV